MLYLHCSGPVRPGRPTVILISGYHNSSDPWTQQDVLSLLPQATGPSVLPGLARTDRVCAYDRPGTVRYIDGLPLTNRSTPVAQPRTVEQLAVELKALLSAAQVPGPYILVGHSLGGLIALFYARTFPEDVRGIVFVDAFSPTIPTKLGRLWPLYLSVLNPPPEKQPIASLKQAMSETVEIDISVEQVKQAPPLRSMPLAVLTQTEPFRVPPDSLPSGLTLSDIDEQLHWRAKLSGRLGANDASSLRNRQRTLHSVVSARSRNRRRAAGHRQGYVREQVTDACPRTARIGSKTVLPDLSSSRPSV